MSDTGRETRKRTSSRVAISGEGSGNGGAAVDSAAATVTGRSLDPVDRPNFACINNRCHKVRESLFSSRSGFLNYRGILNDCIICLVLSNAGNVITNLIKYGVLVNPIKFILSLIQFHDYTVAGFLAFFICVFPVLALLVEKVAAKGYLSEKLVFACYFVINSSLLLLPAILIPLYQVSAVNGLLIILFYIILWMKLISYGHTNSWHRQRRKKNGTPVASVANDNGKDPVVSYPDNLNVTDMIYFWAAPTMCYEVNFPRSPRIRKVFLARRTLEALFLVNILLIIYQQWLTPTILHSVEPFQKMDYAKMVERILLLALPNHLFWLLAFYFFFHSIGNIVSEILRFGDRCFYKDWWNADSIQQFWRQWNMPVHNWAMRHVYCPIIELGYSKYFAMTIVFLLSALFHELLVSLPLKMVRVWAFLGISLQIPLAVLTSLPFMKGQPGNVVVWVSIILGQPLAILMYMHDYYIMNLPGNYTSAI